MIKYYGLNHLTMFSDLNSIISKQVLIGGKKYKELLNIVYELPFSKKIIKEAISPPHLEDEYERDYLFKRLDDVILILKKDINSRQAIYANLYSNKMGKCITTVHFFVRNNKIHLNTYFRSQEAIKNFRYDHQTHCLLVKEVSRKLRVGIGTITVFVANFHKMEE